MTLSIDERNAIVSYRVENAKKTIREIEEIIPLGLWNTIANRLYFSVYYIASALLIKNGYAVYTYRSHIVVRNSFALHCLTKTKGIMDSRDLRLYSTLFDFRLKGDYDDFFDLTENDILPLIKPAKDFINKIEELI